MNEVDYLNVKLAVLATAARDAAAVSGQQVSNAIADCERTLKRITARAETLPDDYERIEIRQMRGPVVEFTGRLLCETEFTTRGRQPLDMVLEVWETRGGALVAISASTLPGGTGREDERATVVPPTDDVQAMRFAVMDAFEWETNAKTMVRKKLGWDLRLEVD